MGKDMKLTTAESIAVMALLHGELMDIQSIILSMKKEQPYLAPEIVLQALEQDIVSIMNRYSKFAAAA